MIEGPRHHELYVPWSEAICQALLETVPAPQLEQTTLYLLLINASHALASMLSRPQPELYECLKKDFRALYKKTHNYR